MGRALILVLLAFVVMEPVTYLVHRYVMHGIGLVWHRSHHRRWPTRRDGDPFLEANDGFPVVFAGIVVVALALGFNVDGFGALLPVCVGVTLYGVAYAFVHDVHIHQRLPIRVRSSLLDRLAEAHALHHRFGGEPYGMLVPIVPREVRARAEASERRRDGHAASSERPLAVPRP